MSYAPNPLRLGNDKQVCHFSRLAGFIIFTRYEKLNSQVAFYKTDTFIRNKYMTYEYDLHESKEAGKAEGRKEERKDALAVLQDMNLSPEQIAEFKARLEAKSAQK